MRASGLVIFSPLALWIVVVNERCKILSDFVQSLLRSEFSYERLMYPQVYFFLHGIAFRNPREIPGAWDSVKLRICKISTDSRADVWVKIHRSSARIDVYRDHHIFL